MFHRESSTLRVPALTSARTVIAVLAMLGVVMSSVLGACKEAEKKINYDVPPAPTNKNAEEATKDLPADFIKTLPIYPGARVDAVRKPKGAMREIMFSTEASLDELVAYYKKELKERGFHITSSLIMAARRTWSCDFHKEGMQATVLLFPHDHEKSRMTIDLVYEIPRKVDPSLLEPVENYDVIGPGEYVQSAQSQQEKAKRN
jgi:hypothetical protein